MIQVIYPIPHPLFPQSAAPLSVESEINVSASISPFPLCLPSQSSTIQGQPSKLLPRNSERGLPLRLSIGELHLFLPPLREQGMQSPPLPRFPCTGGQNPKEDPPLVRKSRLARDQFRSVLWKKSFPILQTLKAET